MTTVFLDAQVWNYLADPTWISPTGLSSERLLAAVEGCEVVGSFELVQELMGTARSNEDKYFEMLETFERLVGYRILMPLKERHLAEAHAGGLLPLGRRFATRELRRDLRSEARKPQSVAEIADLAYAETGEFRSHEEALRAKVLGELEAAGESTRPQRLRDWFTSMDIDAWIRDMVAHGVEQGRYDIAIPSDCGPARFPSAWMFTACRLARLPFTLGERRRIQGSDLADAHHISCSPYVDLLVTNDGELTRTAQLMVSRPMPLRCVTLDQFVER